MPDAAHSAAFVTINLGGVLCENARESFQAAAQRWGASYVELSESYVPAGMNPHVVKLRLFDLVPEERIFYLDGADALVRGAAPSPFEVCPPEKLGVVKNAYPRFPDWSALLEQEDADWEVINEVCGRRLEKGSSFFNSGMLILTRRHHRRMLERAYELRRLTAGRLIWRDQSVMSYAAVELSVPLLLMDETWNYVHPEDAGHWDWMERNVYHFAGSPDRRTVIPGLNWRMPWSNQLAVKLGHHPRLRKLVAWSETRLRFPSWRRIAAGGRCIGNLIRRVPVLGTVALYFYWWAALPWKVTRTLNHTRMILERQDSLRLRIARLERWAEDLKERRSRGASPEAPTEVPNRQETNSDGK